MGMPMRWLDLFDRPSVAILLSFIIMLTIISLLSWGKMGIRSFGR